MTSKNMPSDEEVMRKLSERTDQELIDFSRKLRKIDSPQAFSLRFFIARELLCRSLISGGDRSTMKKNRDVFTEEKDGITYILCDLPNHYHYIPVVFESCYQQGCWTWESKYAR